MPPMVQRACVEGSTGKNSPCCRSAAFRWPSTRPGSTSAVRASGSTCRMRRRCFEQSITSARFTVWPHWLVPPPRGSTGHAFLARDRQRRGDVVDLLRHDHADRLDLVDRGVGGVAAAVGAVEQHLAADLAPQAVGETGIAWRDGGATHRVCLMRGTCPIASIGSCVTCRRTWVTPGGGLIGTAGDRRQSAGTREEAP